MASGEEGDYIGDLTGSLVNHFLEVSLSAKIEMVAGDGVCLVGCRHPSTQQN
jgi:hypothetical protein